MEDHTRLVDATVDASPADTRARILNTALDLFVAHGYQRTTLRQIADRLGVTKTAILYHFPSKERIVTALAEPLVDQLEAAVDRAAGREPAAARRVVVEGMLDAYFDNRRALLMARHDLAFMAQEPMYHRLMRIVQRAIDIIAGPDATMTERVRAMQVMSVLGDPVLFFPDAAPQELRPAILAGVQCLLEGADRASAPGTGPVAGPDAGPHGRSPSGRPTGRPRALRGEALAEARRMYAARTHTVPEIAATLGVSRATVYRHVADQFDP